MYAQVVVLTYQSPEVNYYTYEIPKEMEGELKIGQLVSVPFGKRNPFGIISSVDKQLPESIKNIKPITSIIQEEPLLFPYQIKLLTWISAYYIAPMVNCLEAMLPTIPKRLTANGTQSTAKFASQTLVLVPSINHLPQALARFTLAKNHIVYTNELKITEKFLAWQKISSGQHDFIFGSRSVIFSPCPNLKKIVIFDEHDHSYKDDRSPYFDTLTIAEKISELTEAKIEIVDSSPRVTTFANHQGNINFSVIASETKQSQHQVATSRPFNEKGGTRNDKTNLPQTKIISLAIDRKLGNYSPISSTLEEIIKRAYAKKLSILLFLNKKIESGSIYCKSCKYQEFFKTQPDVCPNCQSPEIFFNSTNINTLSKEVKKNLLNPTINILTEGVKFSTFNFQLSTITIATSSVFYRLLTKKYDLVAHIYADSPLNFKEYNSSEEIYTQITNLKKLTKKLLVVQTYNEDLPALKFAVSGNYDSFYKSELPPRKLLSYPPYSLLVKITASEKKEIKAEKKSQQLLQDIKQSTLRFHSGQAINNLSSDLSAKVLTSAEALAKEDQLSTVSVLGPFKSYSSKKLSYNIILKIPLDNYSLTSREKALSNIKGLIPRQKDVRIIVEPKNLN